MHLLRGRETIHATEGARYSDIDPTNPPTILRNQSTKYTGYESIVQALYRKYNGLDTYGNGLVRQLVDFRATQIAGNGFNLRSEHPETNAFLQQYVRYNQLSGQRGWAWVRDSELEGRSVLINALVKADDNWQVRARSIPWYRWRYKITGQSDDAETIDRVEFTDSSGELQSLTIDKATYIKLSGATVSGNTYCLNDTVPRVGLCLDRIESIDRAMDDLRGNNSLFGRPVRYAQVPDEATANALRESLFGQNARAATTVMIESGRGEFYILAGSIAYAEPSGAANEAILKEITMAAQLISGQTGMPVHYMGFPELMSNRATADDMHELINSTTAKEREAWKTGVQEHASKAVQMYAEATGADLQPDSVICSLPVVMLSSIERVASVWMPLYEGGIISKQTVREQVPGIDPEVEAQADMDEDERKEEESVRMADLITKRMQQEDDNETDPAL